MYYFLQLWHSDKNWRFLVPAGLLAGFAFAVKYTAVMAVVYAILFVAWSARRRNVPILRPIALVASLAFIMIAPWLIKNWIFVRNPVAPLANSLFPNPYFHISAEQDLRAYTKMYDLTSYRELPLELTVRGEKLAGLFGPVLLLAPLVVFALPYPAGRQLLLAALVLGSTYFNNIGARLLMPVIPFVCLALTLVLQRFRWVLFGLALAQAILCWPWVLKTYCSQYAWRLDKLPVAQAFRRESEDHYMARTWPAYHVDRMLDAQMRPSDKVFSFGGIPEAYTSRQILVQGQGAQNEVLGDMLATALITDFQPRHLVDFHFPEQQLSRVRVVQTARLATDQWDVSEFRVFNKGLELARDPHWRLLAHPNPWDVQLAFDNAPVTRWRSWQAAQPGMFLEIDFGAPRAVDSVRIETSDHDLIKMRVAGMKPSGGWFVLSDQEIWSEHALTQNLRRSATEEFTRRGVRYLLIDSSNYRADDFFTYSANWGLKELGRPGTARLYRIE